MSKQSRLNRQTPNTTVRIVLSPREFAELQGISSTATLKVQAIQQQAAKQMADVQRPRELAFLRLVKRYRSKGLRPDVDYAFDEATHSLVAIERK